MVRLATTVLKTAPVLHYPVVFVFNLYQSSTMKLTLILLLALAAACGTDSGDEQDDTFHPSKLHLMTACKIVDDDGWFTEQDVADELVLEKRYFDDEGELAIKDVYTYNERTLEKVVTTGVFIEGEYVQVFEYFKDGSVKKMFAEGTDSSESTYEWNTEDKWTVTTTFETGDEGLFDSHEAFRTDGLVSSYKLVENGDSTTTETFSYDEQGKLTGSTLEAVGSEGAVTAMWTSEYLYNCD